MTIQQIITLAVLVGVIGALIADRVYAELNAQLPADTPDTPAQENESSSSSCFIQALAWE